MQCVLLLDVKKQKKQINLSEEKKRYIVVKCLQVVKNRSKVVVINFTIVCKNHQHIVQNSSSNRGGIITHC